MRIAKLSRTCWMCPSQWEGETDDGRPVYIRYRFANFTVQVGDPGKDIQNALEKPDLVYERHGDSWDGFMDEETLEEILEKHGISLADSIRKGEAHG